MVTAKIEASENHCEVAVVEDDPDIRETLRFILETEGYKVSSFANGQEALDGIRASQDVRLILLDLMMPVMSGWEFLKARRIRGAPLTQIPVIVVSAVADDLTSEDAVQACIKKPLDIDTLLRYVKQFCQPQVV